MRHNIEVQYKDIYEDGKDYDAQHSGIVADIEFFINQVKKYGGPVLELACGTGRITIPIAKEGYEIVGMDISDSFIEHAKSKASYEKLKIDFIKEDIRNLNLARQFKVIFIPFNSLAHIYDLKSIISCFTQARKHLTPDGVFIIDIFNPDFKYFMRDPDKRYLISEYKSPCTGKNISLEESSNYDKASQINRNLWHFTDEDGQYHIRELNMRIFYPQEIDAHLHYNGFEIIEKYGYFDESPFTSDSPKQIIVSKKYSNG
jgi:SAM-dependent methyltransferase